MATTELISTGIVELGRGGFVHRGQYNTDGTVVIVIYGGYVRKTEMHGLADMPHIVARRLLREIIADLHAHV